MQRVAVIKCTDYDYLYSKFQGFVDAQCLLRARSLHFAAAPDAACESEALQRTGAEIAVGARVASARGRARQLARHRSAGCCFGTEADLGVSVPSAVIRVWRPAGKSGRSGRRHGRR